MSERLKELQRQRALVQEQLAWLDREIAATQGAAATGVTPLVANPLPARQSVLNPMPASQDDLAAKMAAEEIMAQYQNETQSLHGAVKRGCFLYFFIALGLVALGVIALYFFRTRGA